MLNLFLDYDPLDGVDLAAGEAAPVEAAYRMERITTPAVLDGDTIVTPAKVVHFWHVLATEEQQAALTNPLTWDELGDEWKRADGGPRHVFSGHPVVPPGDPVPMP